MLHMKNTYEEIKIEILFVLEEDVLTASSDEWSSWY